MPLRLKVENYRCLTSCDWTLDPGVSLLVGPNGSGKSTLLDVPLLLRHAIEVGTRSAVDRHGGPGQILNLRASTSEQVKIEASSGDVRWELRLIPTGGRLGSPQRITKGELQFVEEPPAGGLLLGLSHEVDVDATRVALVASKKEASPEMKAVAEQMHEAVHPLVDPLRDYELFGAYILGTLTSHPRLQDLIRLEPRP